MVYAGLDFVPVEDSLELLIPCLHLFSAGTIGEQHHAWLLFLIY